MPKVVLVPTGQNVIDIYLHPRCSDIGATEDGSVYTCWSKGKNQNSPPARQKEWRKITSYCGARFRPNHSISLPVPVHKALGLTTTRILSGRLNLECYLGRSLHPWEVCRHGKGGNQDHSKANLKAGCQLNNIIDDVEYGKIPTTPEQVEDAINRLQVYLTNSTKPNDPAQAAD